MSNAKIRHRCRTRAMRSGQWTPRVVPVDAIRVSFCGIQIPAGPQFVEPVVPAEPPPKKRRSKPRSVRGMLKLQKELAS